MADSSYYDKYSGKFKVVIDEELSPDAEAAFLIASHENPKVKSHVPKLSSYRAIWICHAISIIMCTAILAHATYIYQKLPKNCLEKFNSYCMSN
jgi:hypothetical protein